MRNTSPDISFNQSINPYRGCEHGCIYCFARPTHAWHDLSPGLDFETKLFAKPDAPALLRAALAKRGYVCQPIAFGTNTDPYQPLEKKMRITRSILEVLRDFRHPVAIVTKSPLILRDIEANTVVDVLPRLVEKLRGLSRQTTAGGRPAAPRP